LRKKILRDALPVSQTNSCTANPLQTAIQNTSYKQQCATSRALQYCLNDR